MKAFQRHSDLAERGVQCLVTESTACLCLREDFAEARRHTMGAMKSALGKLHQKKKDVFRKALVLAFYMQKVWTQKFCK